MTTSRRRLLNLLSIILAAAVFGPLPTLAAPPVETAASQTSLCPDKASAAAYLQAVQDGIAQTQTHFAVLVDSAEQAAKRCVAGSKLYAGGRQEAFAAEASGRAGGLLQIQALGAEAPQPGDTLLYAIPGCLNDEDRQQIQAWRSAGVYVIAFAMIDEAANDRGAADALIANTSLGLVTAGQGEGNLIPLDTMLNVINLWAWTGEFVAACTREGKTPTLYQSYGLPGGYEWGARYAGKAFHDDLQVAPVGRGELGGAYLQFIHDAVDVIAREELDAIRTAASWWRQSEAKGIELQTMGHLFPGHLLDARGPQPVLAPDTAPALIVAITYQKPPTELIEKLDAATKLVFWSARPPEDIAGREHVLYINPHWPVTDGCITLPGYPHPILPASGVMDSIIYRCILAEAGR